MNVILAKSLKVAHSLASPAGERAALSILIYHRVLAKPDPLFPETVDIETFSQQMQLLSQNCHVLPLLEAVDRLQRGCLPAAAACVTFDDGYADNLLNAQPVLKRYGIPATVFVATGFLDGGIMFNDVVIEAIRRCGHSAVDLSAFGLGQYDLSDDVLKRDAIMALLTQLKYLPFHERMASAKKLAQYLAVDLPTDLMLTTDQLKMLATCPNIEIGAHTDGHPILATLDDAAVAAEIAQGKRHLEDILQRPILSFAYPNGRPGKDYLANHPEIVANMGFKLAVTTSPGVAKKSSDLFQLPRFTPWGRGQFSYGLRLIRNCMSGDATVI